jgi:hypothetical protein
MKPADVLARCPDELLRRRPGPGEQIQTARMLAHWLLVRGARPSLLEIEAERSRRASNV